MGRLDPRYGVAFTDGSVCMVAHSEIASGWLSVVRKGSFLQRQSHPLYSLAGDFRMFYLVLNGKMEQEIDRLSPMWSHPRV